VAAAHSVDVQVLAWTVDSPERIAELIELGVDGICSNDPRLLPKSGGS
jgi:glycerophosphoryl diester phosphodiesterase